MESLRIDGDNYTREQIGLEIARRREMVSSYRDKGHNFSADNCEYMVNYWRNVLGDMPEENA